MDDLINLDLLNQEYRGVSESSDKIIECIHILILIVRIDISIRRYDRSGIYRSIR